jgi:hypothetical protein
MPNGEPMAPKTERLGVAALQYFFGDVGWLFREQYTHDYGIDAHVEIVEGDRPTGKLIAFQIKSGSSFYAEQTADSIVFRTDEEHVNYWLNHSMPVVVVIFDPKTKAMHWQQISKETAESTGKKWKVLLPKANDFADAKATLGMLSALTQPEPYIRRLNKLRLDRYWIERLAAGNEVKVEFDDWVNKSLPRFQITLSSDGETEVWPTVYGPGMTIEAMLSHFLPWADFALDEDAHHAGAEEDWMAECYSYRDSETGEIFYTKPFEEWYEPAEGIVPVSRDGEIDRYSLTLSLNELGRSFLVVDEYLEEDSDLEGRTFTIE